MQWALAYSAAAFALLQGADIVAHRFGWPEQTMRLVIIVLSIGLLVTLGLGYGITQLDFATGQDCYLNKSDEVYQDKGDKGRRIPRMLNQSPKPSSMMAMTRGI